MQSTPYCSLNGAQLIGSPAKIILQQKARKIETQFHESG
jgi:hypothetical protein